MSHNLTLLNQLSPNAIPNRRQAGFLLPLALFIVVVMGLIALVLTRTTQQTGMASVQEAVSVQAFYAAESGAQRGMQNLFYDNDIKRQTVDGRCAGSVTYPFTVPGLNNCSAVVTCTCTYKNNTTCASGTAANYGANSTVLESYYTVKSVGTCGNGKLSATRTIQAASFLTQE